MSDRATLLTLAERCEQAAGPDGMLDYKIAWAAGLRFEKAKFEKRKWWRDSKGVRCSGLTTDGTPPRFTASLDAAVTLVPAGWRYDLTNGDLVSEEKPAARLTPDCAGPRFDGYAQTVPRALCAAALRARAALGEKQ